MLGCEWTVRKATEVLAAGLSILTGRTWELYIWVCAPEIEALSPTRVAAPEREGLARHCHKETGTSQINDGVEDATRRKAASNLAGYRWRRIMQALELGLICGPPATRLSPVGAE